MQLFLDGASPQDILEARSWDLLSGVTATPSLIPTGGLDIVTMKMEFMRPHFEHPFTDKRIGDFLKDWA